MRRSAYRNIVLLNELLYVAHVDGNIGNIVVMPLPRKGRQHKVDRQAIRETLQRQRR